MDQVLVQVSPFDGEVHLDSLGVNQGSCPSLVLMVAAVDCEKLAVEEQCRHRPHGGEEGQTLLKIQEIQLLDDHLDLALGRNLAVAVEMCQEIRLLDDHLELARGLNLAVAVEMCHHRLHD